MDVGSSPLTELLNKGPVPVKRKRAKRSGSAPVGIDAVKIFGETAVARTSLQGSLASETPSSRLSRRKRQPLSPPPSPDPSPAQEKKSSLVPPPPLPSPSSPSLSEAKEVRPKRKRSFPRLKRFFRVLLTIVCLLIALAVAWCVVPIGGIYLYNVTLSSDTFTLRHIDVTGNVRLSKEDVLSLGKIHEGVNTFSVSVAEVEQLLRKTPWVKDVSVTRVLPDRFVIKVAESLPSFWVQKEGKLFYANERGEAIAPVEGEKFLSLPLLTVEENSETNLPYLERLMEDMRSGNLPVEAGTIASVRVSASRGIEFFLDDRNMSISIAVDDWTGNLARLTKVLRELSLLHELSKVKLIHSANHTVWIKFRENS